MIASSFNELDVLATLFYNYYPPYDRMGVVALKYLLLSYASGVTLRGVISK